MPKKIAITVVLFLVYGTLSHFNFYSHKVSADQLVVGSVLGAFERSEKHLLFKGEEFPVSGDVYREPIKRSEENFNITNINSSLVIDAESGKVLFDKNSDTQVGIASITKLATALTFLDLDLDLDVYYRVKHTDRVAGGRVYIYGGDEVRLRDLLHLSLVASANSATCALVGASGLSEQEFISKMNEKMKKLGLEKTFFYDAIGLDNNVSTASEIAKLLKISLDNKDIANIVKKKKYEFETYAGKKRVVSSTDYLLQKFPQNSIELLGGKTGFTNLAGYCFVGKFSQGGNDVISVVLGGNTAQSRFAQTERLIEWVYDSYVW